MAGKKVLSLSKEEMAEFQEAYSAVWKQVEGLEGPSGAKDTLRRLGIVGSDLDRASAKMGNELNFPELLQLMAKTDIGSLDKGDSRKPCNSKSSMKEEITEAFHVFDLDGDGIIDAREFANCLRDTTYFSDDEIKAILAEAQDSRNPSNINYRDFVNKFT